MRKSKLSCAMLLVFISMYHSSTYGQPMIQINDQDSYVVYYGSFAGYGIPLKPVEEISKTEAVSRQTYCMGYYNSSGDLYRFERYVNNGLFFQHDYEYYENGKIKMSKTINIDGKVIIHQFDKRGRPLAN